MKTSRLMGIAILALVFSVTGCQKKLDMPKLEKKIKEHLEKTLKAQITSVTCPKSMKEKKGEKFACSAIDKDGTKAHIEVEMMGDGKVKWNVTKVTLKDGKEMTLPKPGEAPPANPCGPPANPCGPPANPCGGGAPANPCGP